MFDTGSKTATATEFGRRPAESGTLTVEEAGDGDGDGDGDDGEDGVPGFGVSVALVALLAASMLALRRQD